MKIALVREKSIFLTCKTCNYIYNLLIKTVQSYIKCRSCAAIQKMQYLPKKLVWMHILGCHLGNLCCIGWNILVFVSASQLINL